MFRLSKTWMIGLIALAAIPAQASSVVYTVAGKADVTITTSTNTVTISLTDTFANPSDVTDNVSGLFFTLSSAPTSASILNSSAQTATVNSGGSYTVGSAVAPGWALSLVGATTTLDDLAAGGAGPAHTLIGPAGSGGYTAAGGSIAGNSAHNPFLYETATWTLTEAGVTAATTVTSTTFQFGTTDGSNQSAGTLVATPEPSTLAILSVGGILVGLARLRRKAVVR